jgi:hypothetical protein
LIPPGDNCKSGKPHGLILYFSLKLILLIEKQCSIVPLDVTKLTAIRSLLFYFCGDEKKGNEGRLVMKTLVECDHNNSYLLGNQYPKEPRQ